MNGRRVGLAGSAELEVDNCIWAVVENFEGGASVSHCAVVCDEVGAGDGGDRGQLAVDWVADGGGDGARILLNKNF